MYSYVHTTFCPKSSSLVRYHHFCYGALVIFYFSLFFLFFLLFYFSIVGSSPPFPCFFTDRCRSSPLLAPNLAHQHSPSSRLVLRLFTVLLGPGEIPEAFPHEKRRPSYPHGVTQSPQTLTLNGLDTQTGMHSLSIFFFFTF